MSYNTNNRNHVRFSSWGRTRQPKNLRGAHGGAAQLANSAAAAPAGENAGMPTENQRFLHLTYTHDADTAAKTITVWGYSYAIGVWAPIVDIRGEPVELETTPQASKTQIFEISGIDRVHCVSSDANIPAEDSFFAACSTF